MECKEKNFEKNFLMIVKPDGIRYFHSIIEVLEKNQIKILSIKSKHLIQSEVEDVYQEHRGRYFFNTLVDYMLMGKCFLLAVRANFPVIESAKKEIREIAKKQGAQFAAESLTVAVNSTKISETADIGNFIQKFVNEYVRTFDGIHCSDAESAEREVTLFFDPSELKEPGFNVEHSTAIVCQKLIDSQENQKAVSNSDSDHYKPTFFNK